MQCAAHCVHSLRGLVTLQLVATQSRLKETRQLCAGAAQFLIVCTRRAQGKWIEAGVALCKGAVGCGPSALGKASRPASPVQAACQLLAQGAQPHKAGSAPQPVQALHMVVKRWRAHVKARANCRPATAPLRSATFQTKLHGPVHNNVVVQPVLGHGVFLVGDGVDMNPKLTNDD